MNSCYLPCILLCVSLSKFRMCAKTPYGNKKKELSCLNQHFIVYFLLAYVDTQNDQAFSMIITEPSVQHKYQRLYNTTRRYYSPPNLTCHNIASF